MYRIGMGQRQGRRYGCQQLRCYPVLGRLCTERPGALVEVKGAELVEIRDEETKEPIVYEYEGNLYTALEIDYFLGKIIEKVNC
mgnify:CR=1 FL=1